MFRKVGSGNDEIFEISDRKNDFKQLKQFLTKDKTLIGFNNLGFDYPIIHRGIINSDFNDHKGLYKITLDVLNEDWSNIPEAEVEVPQIDLFKIWHYDNKNKSTSLKWLEFALRMENIDDLPYPVGTDLDDVQKDRTIEYCVNDIDATENFYNRSLKHIELREFYTSLEEMNLINASEIKISKEIFAKRLSEVSSYSTWDIKKMRTYRKIVPIKNIIFDYIKFNDPVNQKSLETFKNKKWIKDDNMSFGIQENNKIKFSVNYKNVVREYAEGGLHSFGKPGIYESNEEYVLVDVDFKRSPLKKIA